MQKAMNNTVALRELQLKLDKQIQHKELVFIDRAVEYYQDLIAGARSNTEVIILDSTRDGVVQISEALTCYKNVSTLHIVSHGSSGSVQLGSSQLSLDTIDRYRQLLRDWAYACNENAYILIYGCSVAAGDRGSKLVKRLKEITNIDIVASTSLTGSSAKGGNWEFEVKNREIEPLLAFSAQAIATYDAVFPFDTIYEAENANLFGAIVVSGNGSTGTGYVDYQNLSGDYIEWTVEVPTAGNYDLSWRYANGKTNRPLELAVNGVTQVSSLGFAGTGSWQNWQFVTRSLALQAGTNTIRLTATGSSGANFDYLRVVESSTTTPIGVAIANATATEGTDGFLVFDVTLSSASNQAIILNLAATDETAKGGLKADFSTDLSGNPVDYANQEFEVSADGGNSWQLASNGTNITFAAGQTALKVRLAVNNDTASEGLTAQTMTLRVAGILSGTVNSITDTGTGSIADNDTIQKPDQVHLAWVNDPSTTLTVVWRTYNTSTPSTVEYRVLGETTWQTATGALRPSGTTGTLHEVTIASLNPSTTYEYRVWGDNSVWSDIFTTKTAPSLGPADFTAIYVADTGLIGRMDGLATGTAQVIQEIDALNPLLVLGGGDYAYYNTETRFPTLDSAIDEWFNQWQPVLSNSPIMPTYGNHEIRLGEGFTPWANRFPTPNGLDNRRNYSFDIGDVHFVSILSQEEQKGLSSNQINWIEQDIIAAQQRGQRWIIPYFHAGPFGDGTNHPSNLSVRSQLGPMFERLDVDLVIYSHDQAYERTYPLINVPSSNTPTSLSLTDYTKEDGVVYVKTSPGGKISNKNGGFSQFSTQTPPAYMAFRDNTMHHFSRLIVSDEGSIRLDTYGVIGDGTPPTIIDSFQITDGPDPLMVIISDATATEGTNDFLVFNVTLSSASSQAITLNLAVTDGTAKGGLKADFGIDPSGDPVDYANQEFEVSADGGNSWQPASNGINITFAAGQTALKVRLAVNNDTASEGVTAQTMTLHVASVLSGIVDNVTDTGTGSIADNDGAASFDTIYQAEDANFVGPIFRTGNGAQGTGYLDYQNPSGDYIEWTVVVPTAGTYDLSWRYTLGSGTSTRPLQLDVNGSTIVPSLEFVRTSNWSTWAFVTQTVTLQTGENKIRLTATGSSGANFDYLRVLQAPTAATAVQQKVAIDEALAVEFATPNVTSTLSEPVDTNADSTASVTVNNVNATGFDTIYQAEDANFVGASVVSGNGSTGTGYVDYQNPSGDYIEWIVNVPTAGTYDLSWRYANGKTNRPLALAVNGVTQISNLSFFGTGSWQNWQFVTRSLTLQAGTNTIRLTATGSSGANFDYLRVLQAPTTTPINVAITNATATEGTDGFLVFDVTLSSASSQAITLNLATTDGTAKGGLKTDFGIDPSGDPVDYANQEFEVSADGGNSWQPASNGTNITFAAGQTALKVRLAVNNDTASEGVTAQTMTLLVANVLSGIVDNVTDTGTGSIFDNDGDPGLIGTPISLLPYTEVRVEGDYILGFDGNDGGLVDKDGQSTGFTMADPSSNPGNPSPISGVVGYWPEKLDVDPATGLFKITATSGLQIGTNNSLDNALGVGLNVPSQPVKLQTTLVNLPAAPGGFAQAGLWFGQSTGGNFGGGSGTSEDNYIKFVVISNTTGNYRLQALQEQDGATVSQTTIEIPDNPTSVKLNLYVSAEARSVTARYSLNGGTEQTVATFANVPDEWFSFDQAGINPEIATRSFGGIFASHRNASSSQVFTFDDFAVTEESFNPNPPPPPTDGAISFDRWSIPINSPTSMEIGPDGKLYVATLFGTIYAISFNPDTRTYTTETINTITQSEGGNRLTLGLAIDPESTANNVILWVAHSNGSVSNGAFNSGKVSRLSGSGFSQKTDVITGLPRAIANHATNDIDFGPDGKLYLYQGGNTGAGSANTANTEFKDRAEQVLSAALLVADVKKAGFNGDVAALPGEFIDQFYARKAQELGRPYTDVEIYASGLRNTYDGIFHSNGQIYAPDNGLGVTGTVPPVPRLGDPSDRSITTLFGNVSLDNPGSQPDPLNRIVQGGYYGHPNPYRDEVIFKDGSFQGFNASNRPPGHPAYTAPLFNLGNNKSANGIIEYTGNNLFGQLKGDLLITNYSSGDNLTRIKLAEDGLSVVNSSSLVGGFSDPLPIAMGPNGSVIVGEFGANKITILEPLGIWRSGLPKAPLAILDAGSAAVGGKMYMVGGKTSTAHLNSLYIYNPGDPINPNDDSWATGPALPGSGVENPAVVGLNGKLYSFGGSTAPFSGAVQNSAVFNPSTNNWSSLAPMPTARGGASAQVINGDIYVIGGMNDSGASVDTVEVYDPETNTWSTTLSMSTRRDNPGAAVIDNKLYVMGGRTRNADGSVADGTLNTMEIYDPLTGLWEVGTSMITGRRTFAVGTIDDKIQVIGGEAPPGGGSAFNQNEEYDPILEIWRSLPSIPTARHGSAFATIDDVIYVAGGGTTVGSSFTDVVEAFTV
jgi:glucose/arabinose dehydrogenase/N-acetylneuraminic acid mutarotase